MRKKSLGPRPPEQRAGSRPTPRFSRPPTRSTPRTESAMRPGRSSPGVTPRRSCSSCSRWSASTGWPPGSSTRPGSSPNREWPAGPRGRSPPA